MGCHFLFQVPVNSVGNCTSSKGLIQTYSQLLPPLFPPAARFTISVYGTIMHSGDQVTHSRIILDFFPISQLLTKSCQSHFPNIFQVNLFFSSIFTITSSFKENISFPKLLQSIPTSKPGLEVDHLTPGLAICGLSLAGHTVTETHVHVPIRQ